MDMNRFRIPSIIIVFSTLSYLSVTFLKNYNSPENIEKRCILKFEKDFKNFSELSPKDWDLNLDLADNNYLNVWVCHFINYGRSKEKKRSRNSA